MPVTSLKQVCMALREQEIAQIRNPNHRMEHQLTDREINRLAECILVLPESYQEVLMARFCYQLSIEETRNIFGIADPEKTFYHAQCALGYAFDLPDNECIGIKSIHDACVLACDTYICTVKQQSKHTDFPRAAKEYLQNTHRGQRAKRLTLLVLKRVAMFLLVILASGTMVLSVNASLRERFFNWVISVYEEYSAFSIVSANEVSLTEFIDVQKISFGYMPDEFEKAEKYVDTQTGTLHYVNPDGKQIFLTIVPSDGTEHNVNTEAVTPEEIVINGHEGFFWLKNQSAFVVWEQNNHLFALITDLDRETTVKVAENIHISGQE